MHVVIMGCGRVGSGLAKELEAAGHSISVIDQDREAFRRLGADFKGQTVTGIGFDRDVLVEAGIERAEAFAAVSNGDNSNILAARVARETFGVENVVARIYDPARAEIYQRLGIPTVATVIWATDQILRRLTPKASISEWQDATGAVQLFEVTAHKDYYGQPISIIQQVSKARVSFLTRLGEAMVPTENTVLQDGDLIHVMASTKELKNIELALSKSPEEA